MMTLQDNHARNEVPMLRVRPVRWAARRGDRESRARSRGCCTGTSRAPRRRCSSVSSSSTSRSERCRPRRPAPPWRSGTRASRALRVRAAVREVHRREGSWCSGGSPFVEHAQRSVAALLPGLAGWFCTFDTLAPRLLLVLGRQRRELRQAPLGAVAGHALALERSGGPRG